MFKLLFFLCEYNFIHPNSWFYNIIETTFLFQMLTLCLLRYTPSCGRTLSSCFEHTGRFRLMTEPFQCRFLFPPQLLVLDDQYGIPLIPVIGRSKDVPLLMTLPSTNHSPKTVKRKAMAFTIGTVRLNSSRWQKNTKRVNRRKKSGSDLNGLFLCWVCRNVEKE